MSCRPSERPTLAGKGPKDTALHVVAADSDPAEYGGWRVKGFPCLGWAGWIQMGLISRLQEGCF